MSVPFRISCSNDARAMIFFCLFCRFLGSGMSKIYNSTHHLSRVILYVKVTWPWAWLCISHFIDESAMISFVLQVFRVRDVKNIQFFTPTITRYLVRHGHVTMSVTLRFSCSNDARAIIFFLFLGFSGSGMSKVDNSTHQLSRVTLYVRVTWP